MISEDNPFSGRLLSGEHVLWSGRPGQGIVFSGQDWYAIPFTVIWCGIAFSSLFATKTAAAAAPFDLMKWLFVAVGVYALAGRFLVDAWVRRGMRYAVTDQRVLILRPAPFSKFIAIGLKQLPETEINERADGRGTIRFVAQAASAWRRGNASSLSPVFDAVPQFIAIEDARRVFDIVQRAAGKMS